jgi:hypothetical protein
MATDTENSIVPPSQTSDGEVPNADAAREMLASDPALDLSARDDTGPPTSGADLPDGEGVDPAKRDAAMNPMQAVHDYEATKRG